MHSWIWLHRPYSQTTMGILAKSNEEQVKRTVTIAPSIEPANPDEARKILGLKGQDKVNW
jgi:uncharacterized protein (DUF849 family)